MSKNEFLSGLSRAINYRKKVERISNNFDVIESFCAGEIASGLFDYDKAKDVLEQGQLDKLLDVYTFYNESKAVLLFSYEQWKEFCLTVMVNYDLVCPYYKISGQENNLELARVDKEKERYRTYASSLIEKNLFITIAWAELVEKFKNEFYSL